MPPTNPDPFLCQFNNLPQVLLDFAAKNDITPYKWRIQNGEYILFSDRLQKYHIPIPATPPPHRSKPASSARYIYRRLTPVPIAPGIQKLPSRRRRKS